MLQFFKKKLSIKYDILSNFYKRKDLAISNGVFISASEIPK